jgi:hypothetical protein
VTPNEKLTLICLLVAVQSAMSAGLNPRPADAADMLVASVAAMHAVATNNSNSHTERPARQAICGCRASTMFKPASSVNVANCRSGKGVGGPCAPYSYIIMRLFAM